MDRSIFNIFDTDGDGVVADVSAARLALDLIGGQYGEISRARVIEYNVAEKWSRDVTEDMAWTISELLANRAEPISNDHYDFIWTHCGIQAADCFRRAA